MTITGLDTAIEMAIERANRSKQSICVVQIGENEYVLWRESTVAILPTMYKYYKVVKIIRIRNDDFR